MICPRCRQVFLPESLFPALASEASRKGTMKIDRSTVSITTTCPYCRFGPIHSREFVRVCSNCGGICPKEARFCPRCGAPTTEPGSQRSAQIAAKNP